MKKILKNVVGLSLIAAMLMFLVACGKEEEKIPNNVNEEPNQVVNNGNNISDKTNENVTGNENITGTPSNNSESNAGYDITAARTVKEEDIEIKETQEIKFKNDEVDEIRFTQEFLDEKTASDNYLSAREAFKEGTVSLEGKRIIITLTSKNFERAGIAFDGKSEEETKKMLKESGYEIK
jgi:hypothetical protein